MDRALHDGLFVMNYVDHGAGDGPRDFRCGTRTFDGHRGLDLSLTGFRAMDQGTPVVAAAAGRVLVAQYDQFDRNFETPYVGTLSNVNQIQILHDDGTAAWYAHLRKNSVAVAVGERVERGQFLGLIGSSGWSPLPHLHFELWAGPAFGSAIIDPFGQPCAEPPSRWASPTAYSGNDGINLYDADVTLDLALVGTRGNELGLLALKERLDRPAVVAADEPALGVWLFHQSPRGGPYSIVVERPDGSAFANQSRTSTPGLAYTWEVVAIPFAAGSPPSGEWTLRVEAGARRIVRRFTVGTATAYGPRFYPLAGKSLRLGADVIVDQLALKRGAAGVTLRLDGAPPAVTLDGSSVRIPPAALSGPTAAFRVIAEDAAGRADTMHYHVVDPGRFGAAAGSTRGRAPERRGHEALPSRSAVGQPVRQPAPTTRAGAPALFQSVFAAFPAWTHRIEDIFTAMTASRSEGSLGRGPRRARRSAVQRRPANPHWEPQQSPAANLRRFRGGV